MWTSFYGLEDGKGMGQNGLWEKLLDAQNG